MKAEKNMIVKINYTGKLDDGSTFDTSEGKEPLTFTLGEGKVIPGFEKAILGMEVGASQDVVIPSEEAYGPRREELVQKVPKEALGEIEAKKDMILAVQLPQVPQPVPAKVLEVTETEVTIDLNPPLAGQTLHFHITLVSAEKASEKKETETKEEPAAKTETSTTPN